MACPARAAWTTGIHVSEVDYIIDGDHAPAPELLSPPVTGVDTAVGRLIAAEIEDGACLQIGIGGMPDAVCPLLLESGAKDLGVHSGMLTGGLMDLYRAGRVTGARKALHPGRVAYSFSLGSSSLHAAIDRSEDLPCLPVDQANLPHVIMQDDRVISVDNTTQIDLQGQAASESDGHRHVSGTGGQLQFVRGACACKDGKSFMCLASTYDWGGVRRSRIVVDLTPGNIAATPRTDVVYVVTEYGVANLKGEVRGRAGDSTDLHCAPRLP